MYSIRATAEAHGIAFSTLRGRIQGATTRVQSHTPQQPLTPTDEKAVLRWITDLENTKFPPRIDHVQQATTLLAGKPPGKNWITRFDNRHPHLAAKFTSPIEKDRVEAMTLEIVRRHFGDLQKLLEGAEPRDTWNMNEKGFLIGLAQRQK